MWWSDGEWAALHDSETCAMCADSGTAENAHSLLVAETKTSRVRLSRNQEHRGYCIVILRDHRTDLTHLSADELAGFWLDVQRAGMAIDHVFEPRKIDYLVMGHRMPHLHCHVFPQHAHDDPKRNVDISDGPTAPPITELRNDVRRLREAWGKALSPLRQAHQRG